MPINEQIYSSPATKGEIAGVALHAAIGLRASLIAIRQIRAGLPVSDETIDQIQKSADVLGERFNELTGWTDE